MRTNRVGSEGPSPESNRPSTRQMPRGALQVTGMTAKVGIPVLNYTTQLSLRVAKEHHGKSESVTKKHEVSTILPEGTPTKSFLKPSHPHGHHGK